MTVIREFRLDRGLAPEELALSAGISLPEYHDLEDHEDERYIAASVQSIARIAQRLGVKPSAFYEGTSSQVTSLDELVRRILSHLTETGKPLADFEDSVGWELTAALETPARFREFPAAGIRDICLPIGVNWLDVIDGLCV